MKENKLMSKFLSTQWFIDKYAEFNEKYFDDKLPSDIIIETVFEKSSYEGVAYNITPYKIRINISYVYYNLKKEFENTLLHEMIHIWQYENHCADNHGQYFKMKMEEINSKGEHNIRIKGDNKKIRLKIYGK